MVSRAGVVSVPLSLIQGYRVYKEPALLARLEVTPQRGLPLLTPRPWLTLIPDNGMQLDLQRILRAIRRIPLTPVIRYRVGKDVSVARETCSGDRATDFWVAFKTVLGVLVPEVECTIRSGGGEGTVDGVEGDGVYGIDFCDVASVWVLLAVTFERKVEAGFIVSFV
jgi:hypothetical protein